MVVNKCLIQNFYFIVLVIEAFVQQNVYKQIYIKIAIFIIVKNVKNLQILYQPFYINFINKIDVFSVIRNFNQKNFKVIKSYYKRQIIVA